MPDVRSRSGIPIVSDFANGKGTPLVVNQSTGRGYVLKDGDIIVPLGGDIVNVLDFSGIDPNGNNDSTSAANAALAAGYRVYFPAGTYLLNALTSLTSSRIIFGDGRGTLLKFNTTGSGFTFDVSADDDQNSNIVIKDLAFDNITNVPASFIKSGATVSGSLNTLIQRCYFSQCAATYCIDNFIGYGLKIRDCIFNDVTGSCIRLQDSTNQANGYSYMATIDGCDITRPSGDGIVVEGAQGLHVLSTVIQSCGGKGFVTKPLTNETQAWNIHLDTVYFESNTGTDIDLSDCDQNYWTHLNLTNCTFVGTPSIALGSRSEISINGHNSGGHACTVSGSQNAAAFLFNAVNFTQSGSFNWCDLGASVNANKSTTRYLAYTPVLAAGGGSPNIGDGTLTGFYTRIGSIVHCSIYFSPGSTTNFGTGGITFTLPFTASTHANHTQWGTGRITDVGTAAYTAEVSVSSAGTYMTPTQSLAVVTSTAPHAWAAGDTMELSLTYIAG